MGFRFWQALQKLQSVGIEPTLLRTRALSVRLNRSAKTALCWNIGQERLHGAMATRRIPDPKIGGSIPSRFNFFYTVMGAQVPTTFGWVVGGACFLTLLGGGNSNSRQE